MEASLGYVVTASVKMEKMEMVVMDPVIQGPKLRQEDCYKCEISLSYIERSCLNNMNKKNKTKCSSNRLWWGWKRVTWPSQNLWHRVTLCCSLCCLSGVGTVF